MLRNQVSRFANRFGRDDAGSVNIEALLFFPLLISLIAVTMVFYDGFRRDSLNHKAAFTIADMVSRETSTVNPDYISGARDLVAAMIDVPTGDVSVRVTQVTYDAHAGEYYRNWSHGVGASSLSDSQVNARAANLPTLAHGERVVLVDTFVDHDWAIDFGLADGTFTASAITRPRFAPQVAWAN